MFDAFDYVALGHLHGPQRIGRPTVRYAGSPLKYSFSEARQKKSVTFVELKEKGRVEISTVPLVPLHDMREIRGPIAELTKPENAAFGSRKDYIRATLTDEHAVADAAERLRAVYPNLMCIDFESARTAEAGPSKTAASGDVAHRTPQELFEEFYRNQNDRSCRRTSARSLKMPSARRRRRKHETGSACDERIRPLRRAHGGSVRTVRPGRAVPRLRRHGRGQDDDFRRVTFALYGEPSGSTRTADSLRSNFAEPDGKNVC